MSIAAISPHTARILQRIRWLAWGAIAALLAAHGFAAFKAANEPEPMTLTSIAAQPEHACGCERHSDTI